MASNYTDNQYLTRKEIYEYCHGDGTWDLPENDNPNSPNDYATLNELNELGATLVDNVPYYADNQLVPFKYIIPIVGYRIFTGGQSYADYNMNIFIQNFEFNGSTSTVPRISSTLEPSVYFWNGTLSPTNIIYNDFGYPPDVTMKNFSFIIFDHSPFWTSSSPLAQFNIDIEIKSIEYNSTKYNYFMIDSTESSPRRIFRSNIPYSTEPGTRRSVKYWYIVFDTFDLSYDYDQKHKTITSLTRKLNSFDSSSFNVENNRLVIS